MGIYHSQPSPSLRDEAATRFVLILMCGSLISIVVYRDGDGFANNKILEIAEKSSKNLNLLVGLAA
jgi:hypothetical protein